MFRKSSWFGGNWGRPKNPHSLERLKYLHNILCKNTTVSESNRGTLVESLRCIAEILIWGDQNDSSVFDFFLEKNMLSYFLKIMRQKCGGSSYVCVQLLQTLNILFENIRNETSLYYLLSNNHVNSIIVHKFDFSDEEVMAYYISFLKTLSLKLNNHTIHFFYNEHTKDFPLYTEAIKFFNHPESMVRIAVRTLTLNVYRVPDASMLRFIRDRTAAPYFSNLVWFIGKHILELDICVRNNAVHQYQQKLDDLVAEHLDHLHYINDILNLNIPDLNDVLTEHLLHKLLIPLYIYSLTSDCFKKPCNQVQNREVIARNLEAILLGKADTSQRMNFPRQMESDDEKPSVSCVVALFLLSQVFLILTHPPIVHALAWIILQADLTIFDDATKLLETYSNSKLNIKLEFSKPQLSLEKALENASGHDRDYTTPEFTGSKIVNCDESVSSCDLDPELISSSLPSTSHVRETLDFTLRTVNENSPDSPLPEDQSIQSNITDEEKQKILAKKSVVKLENRIDNECIEIEKRPFLKTIFDSLDCSENDYKALFSLCLLYALINNKGVSKELLNILLQQDEGSTNSETVSEATSQSETETSAPSLKYQSSFNTLLVTKLYKIAHLSCKSGPKVRLVSLELTVTLLHVAVQNNSARYSAQIEHLKQRSTSLVRNIYKHDEIFLDMFEDEYIEMCKKPLNVECLCMDSAILLPPTKTPMSGIPFVKRLPSDEIERTRHAIRTFFLIRNLYLKSSGKPETQLPLSNPVPFNEIGDVLDLNDADLISCDIIQKDGTWRHKFVTVDNIQLILVEPDKHKIGWGVAKLVGGLQDLEIQGDKEDPRCLHLTMYKPREGSSPAQTRAVALRAKFKFDDHIRSMAAKQRLVKGRTKCRHKKMSQIERLLELPGASVTNIQPIKNKMLRGVGRPVFTSRVSGESSDKRLRRPTSYLLKDGVVVYKERTASRDSSLSRGSSGHCSRESSPRRLPEDIPLEDIKKPTSDTEVLVPVLQPQPSTSGQSVMTSSSEETSFISNEQSRSKRKGAVEII